MSFVDFSDAANADNGSGDSSADQASPAIDSSGPGYAIPGYPGWRSGASGSGSLLGVVRVSNRGPAQQQDAGALPPGYMYDANGKLQLTPQFARNHPKGPFDFGAMAHNIDWSGVGKDLVDIVGNAASSMLLDLPPWIDLPLTGVETWKAQDKANKPNARLGPSVDRTTNGLP